MNDTVVYLRCTDFSRDGSLLSNSLKDKIVVVMVHADSCYYCKKALPEFQKAASHWKGNKRVCFAGIQIDGVVNGEAECEGILDKILVNYQGVPDYAIFVNNKPMNVVFEERTSEYINALVKKYLK